jgi:hypothetical protein
MDPNKALSDLLDWAKDREDPVAADIFLALDSWLSKGGFLPDRWKRPVAAKTQEPHVPPVLATPAEAFAYRRPAAQLRQATCKVPGCSPENFQHQEPYGPPVPATPPKAFYAQLRQTLHEINQSLHEAEVALHDARTILNIKLPRS